MPNYKIVHRAPALNQKREVRVSATDTATLLASLCWQHR